MKAESEIKYQAGERRKKFTSWYCEGEMTGTCQKYSTVPKMPTNAMKCLEYPEQAWEVRGAGGTVSRGIDGIFSGWKNFQIRNCCVVRQ